MAQYIAFIYDKGNGVIPPRTYQTIVTEYKEKQTVGENMEIYYLKDMISNSSEPKRYKFIKGGISIPNDCRYFIQRLVPYTNEKGFDESKTITSNVLVVDDSLNKGRSYYKKCAVKIKTKIKIH